MPERLQVFDAYLLARFEQFSHWFQWHTGKTCFWLARVLLQCDLICDVAFVVLLVVAFSTLFGTNVFLWPLSFFAVMYVLGGMYFTHRRLQALHGIEEAFERTPGGRNSLGLFWFARILGILSALLLSSTYGVLFLVVLTDHGYLWYLLMIARMCQIAADYFVACTPLPPGWQRQKKQQLAHEGAH